MPKQGLSTKPAPSVADKSRRLVWNVASLFLFRLVPTPLHSFRAFVLKLFGAEIGKNVAVYPTCSVWAPWNLIVEDGATLGGRADLYNVDKILIGKRAIVSQGAYLCTASHDFNSEDFSLQTAPIRVSQNSWIAAEAFIGPGVVVGEHAVVGARAVVTSDIAPRSIVAGNPARRIGERSLKGRNRLT